MVRIKACAGTAVNQLQIPTPLGALCGVRAAEKICVHVKTAVFLHQAREAIAGKQARNRRRTKSAEISATGFLLTQNTEAKPQVFLTKKKKPALQERHSMIYLNSL